MIGVWDTVGELGVPLFNGLRLVDRDELRFLKFSNRELSPRVEHGRQALAIDEERADFPPTLWEKREGIKQVWFAGAHADVGGGYENHGLSDIALEWMMQEVNDLDAGLRLSPSQLSQALAPDGLQDRHDETRGPVWRTRPSKERKIPDNAELHPSVLQRLAERADYRPKALEDVPACADFYLEDEPHPEEELQQEREACHSASCRSMARRASRPMPTNGGTPPASKWTWAKDIASRPAAHGSTRNPAGADGYESKAWFLHLAEGSRRMEERPWFSLVAAIHPDPTSRRTTLTRRTCSPG
jgi:hypothetical protein